jgi:hypothetical protein
MLLDLLTVVSAMVVVARRSVIGEGRGSVMAVGTTCRRRVKEGRVWAGGYSYLQFR